MAEILNKKGGSIIEIIVAMGIFILVAANIIVLSLSAYGSNLRGAEKLQANMYLQQGFEAVRSIRDYDFENLTNGTYGLSKLNGYWELSGSSDTNGQYTRSITIADVARDDDCAIVESGGDIYGSTKKITVSLSWDIESGNSQTLETSQYLTDWVDPIACGQEADNLVMDASSPRLVGGNKKLVGITIENTGSQDITIDKVTISWNNSVQIEQVIIDNIVSWQDSGTGSPTGKQSSGTELDLVDYTLIAGETVSFGEIRFEQSMAGATFTIVITMIDGSSITVSDIQP